MHSNFQWLNWISETKRKFFEKSSTMENENPSSRAKWNSTNERKRTECYLKLSVIFRIKFSFQEPTNNFVSKPFFPPANWSVIEEAFISSLQNEKKRNFSNHRSVTNHANSASNAEIARVRKNKAAQKYPPSIKELKTDVKLILK